jgi:hypothetical protein
MPKCMLQSPGWHPRTRLALETLIRNGAGKRLPVAFDFDNTLVCGDVGEATLAVLARTGKLALNEASEAVSPSFRIPGKAVTRLESCADVAAYYEAFLAPTVHGEADPTPLANGYAWVVEIMEGLSPLEVVKATRSAYGLAVPGQLKLIEITPGQTGFLAPFFVPAMVELLRELLRHQFDIWILSASNVWSVRWMVLEVLNPLLRQAGLRQGLRADHIVGVATLLMDRRGGLHKDSLLVRERPDYAALDPKTLAGFRLTNRLQFPVPTYSGKIACLFDTIGQNPYLCAGDSPGDHSMMLISQHRLWMARLEKPGYQKATAQLIRRTGDAGWLVQATLAKPVPGLVSTSAELASRPDAVSPAVRESLRHLSRWLK